MLAIGFEGVDVTLQHTDRNDDTLHSLDMEYHNIEPESGLYYGLEQEGAMRRVVADSDVTSALETPPQNTRAKGRGAAIRALQARGTAEYIIDWDGVYLSRERAIHMHDPFETYMREVAGLTDAGELG